MIKKLSTCFIITALALAALPQLQAERVKTPEEAQKLVQSLKYHQGEVSLKDGLAKLELSKDFRYLNAEDARKVLVDLWGNPPNPDNLGILLPADKTPLDDDCWVVTISYDQDGYVKDDDANKINYDDLLKTMKKSVHEANAEREKQGYPAAELIGWAATPRYDASAHKLYWAKEFKFAGHEDPTLNYNIRMLGRRGVLVLNAISSMNQLQEIEKQTPQILSMVNFNDGNRYADFDPKVDKVATYGIAALVAGGIAAKLGIFKMVWVFLLAAKKFVIIAVVAVGAWVKKLFTKRDNTPSS